MIMVFSILVGLSMAIELTDYFSITWANPTFTLEVVGDDAR